MKEFIASETQTTIDEAGEDELVGGSHMEDYFKSRAVNGDKSYFIQTHGC